MVDNLTLTGGIAKLDEQITELKQYEQAGLKTTSLRLYTDPAASIRLIGEQVLPALR